MFTEDLLFVKIKNEDRTVVLLFGELKIWKL